jgi:hypothetical protein
VKLYHSDDDPDGEFDNVDGADVAETILAHMIEEYARHDGHADLLRLRIDGAVGE